MKEEVAQRSFEVRVEWHPYRTFVKNKLHWILHFFLETRERKRLSLST